MFAIIATYITARMSVGLFIPSGSFFLGQMKFIPEPIRILPLIFAVAVSPLVMLLYWMWRVRLKRNLRGVSYKVVKQDAALPPPLPSRLGSSNVRKAAGHRA